MTDQTNEILEKIHNLKGADQFIQLCNEIYEHAEQIVEKNRLESFLKMNYIFAVDPGYGFTTAVELFRDLLIAVFELRTEVRVVPLMRDDLENCSSEEELQNRFAQIARERTGGQICDRIACLDPIRTRDTEPYKIMGEGVRNGLSRNLFATMDLIKEELYLETDEMEKFLNKIHDTYKDTILIFHAPFMTEGINSVYERVISKVFPVKVLKFYKPDDKVMVDMCMAQMQATCPDCLIPEQKIYAELIQRNSKGIFRGFNSVDVMCKELLYDEWIGNESFVELTASEQFKALSEKYQILGEQIKQVVLGQEQAINEIMQGLFACELNKEKKKHAPKASFLLMGPPGVGKTLIAKTLGDALDIPTLILNMSDYSGEYSYIDLVGSSKRFRHGSEGKLVQFVRQNAQSIVVFDEVEKSSLDVIHLLLQVLDMGILLDAYTEKYIDFSNTILFFTSNVGKSLYEDERNQVLSRLPKKMLLSALENETRPGSSAPFFPQAICSRMMAGNVIMLNRMDTLTLLEIAKNNMNKALRQFTSSYEIQTEVAEEIFSLFLYHEGGKMDARVASKKSVEFIQNEIYEISRLSEDYPTLLETVHKIAFEVDKTDSEITHLLCPTPGDCNVLFVGKSGDLQSDITDVCVDEVANYEEVQEALEKEYTFILVDPYLGYKKPLQEKLCINDIESEGMHIFYDLMDKQIGIPIYLLDRKNAFSEMDKDSLAMIGASGVITAGAGDEDFCLQLHNISKRHYLMDLHVDFCNRGYCLDFSTRQIVDGDVLLVQFYDLKKRMVPDAQSAKFMVSDVERPNVKLDDVIGAEEAKEELRFFVNYLREPRKMLASGVRAPKGLLLYGKPGTGKTMLAKALAGETDAAFISTNASEFLSAYRGVGEEKIREMFAVARRYAPTILFIDEIDAIGKVRTGQSSDQEVEALLNTLLVEMDGFKSNSNKPVFVLAATNFGVQGDRDKKIRLDPALLRRFDNQIYIDLPKEAERIQYLRMLRDKNSSAEFSDEAIKNVAKRSIGKSIADLQNIYLLAERNASKAKGKVTDEILLDAYEQFLFGLKKEQKEEYYKSTAIHEAGHAYIAHISGNTPTYITITGRANFAGYVAPAVDEDKGNYTEKEYRWMIREKLAGRVAEKVFMGEEESMNTGAQSDLAQATRLAIDMVIRLGFVKGQMITLSYSYTDRFGIPREYLDMANDIILEELQQCETLIVEGKERIRQLADAVLEKNNLTTSQIREVLDGADS